jgi:carboxymethylenebutenolidase
MSERLILKSPLDGFEFTAWRQAPWEPRRAGLIVIQEIFGVTDHIHEVAAGFAEEGYETLCPSLFDRQARDFTADYSAEDIARARAFSETAPWAEVAADLAACVASLAPPVFAVGYCWGGTAAWLAAFRVEGLAAASCYYGRRIPKLLGETPRCPVICHFGKRDASIPAETVDAIAEAYPEMPVYRYDAGHGFSSDRLVDYDPDSTRLAALRTLQLFARAGGRGELS